MKLIDIKKGEKEEVIVQVQVGESELSENGGVKPLTINLNDIVFDSKESALKYYTSVLEHNKIVIVDNETRLEQMPRDSLEKVNDFAEAINKSEALSKRNSQKIEQLINAYNNMRSFERNIEKTIDQNKFIESIIEGLNNLGGEKD